MRKNIIIFLIILFIFTTNKCFALWPTGIGTHSEVTEDTLDYVNEDYYPDLHKFESQLRDGSATEAHSPPDVSGDSPTSPHRWFPNLNAWWNNTTNSEKKCALQLYDEYDFENAYKTIGYMCHNTQDLRVPSHQRLCIHGTLSRLTDGFELWIGITGIFYHDYYPTMTPWQFTLDEQTWNYWLEDIGSYGDDDDENNVIDADNMASLPDHNGDFKSEWEISDYMFGTYGYGETDPIPGKNIGHDAFDDYPDSTIAYEICFDALSHTRSLLVNKSEALSPIIPTGTPYTAPSITSPIFGPNQSVDISFMALENRLPTVKVSILAGTTAIKDTSGTNWDGGSSATYTLSSNSTSGHLPWESTLTKTWSGQLKTGILNDGQHTVKMKIQDDDGNYSQERTLSVKYDKTKPTGSITVSTL